MTLTSFSRSLCCAIYKKIRQIGSTGQISSPVLIKFYIYVVIGPNKILLTFHDLNFIFKVTMLQNILDNNTNFLSGHISSPILFGIYINMVMDIFKIM